MASGIRQTFRHSLIRAGVCVIVSLVLLYLCDVPSSQALDAPIWQALLLDADDADPSEAKTPSLLSDHQPGFASAWPGTGQARGLRLGHPSSSFLSPSGLLPSPIPARAPPGA